MDKAIIGMGLGPEIPDIALDVEAMIGTHTCVIANTGAGKSGLLRVMQEQTRPMMQQVIIDPEGESAGLRTATAEYLIAGGESGDVPATLANAVGLAKALMANAGISAIIQLDHLKPWEQQTFVGAFPDELLHTPAALRHPFLLFLDEAQRWAPQEGNVPSSAPMHDIAARGRKRGISAVFATQRMAGIDKNVTGGVNNWFLGRVAQDADRRAAALALGMSASSAEAKEIAFLPKRQFWAFGPAIAERPILFTVYEAKTVMQKAGAAPVPVAPTPKALQKLVEALAKAAAPETPAAPAPAAGAAPSVDLEAIRDKAYLKGMGDGHRVGQRDALEFIIHSAQVELGFLTNTPEPYMLMDRVNGAELPSIDMMSDPQMVAHLEALRPHIDAEVERHRRGGQVIPDAQPYVSMDRPVQGDFVRQAVRRAKVEERLAQPGYIPTTVPSGKRPAAHKVLDVLKWWADMGAESVSRQRATVMAGYSPKASTFGVYVSRLMKDGLICAPQPGHLALTQTGALLADGGRLGGMDLIGAARLLLSPAEAKVFDVLTHTGPAGISRDDLADRLELSKTSSTLGVYVSKLSGFGFVDMPSRGQVALASWLRA